jgi:hypothetical protein
MTLAFGSQVVDALMYSMCHYGARSILNDSYNSGQSSSSMIRSPYS